MSDDHEHLRLRAQTLPVDELCTLIAQAIRQNTSRTLQNLNALLYQDVRYPIDTEGQRQLLQESVQSAQNIIDIVRDLVIDRLWRRLYTLTAGEETPPIGLVSVICLSNFNIDMDDIAQMYGETQEAITLDGYMDGAYQTITFAGEDARSIKVWLDVAHEQYLQYCETHGMRIAERVRPFQNADHDRHMPSEWEEPPF